MCINAFATGAPRINLHAACGTGKTLIGLNVAQHVAPRGRVLTVVPRLQLLEQSIAAWHGDGRQGAFLAVCSQGPQDPALVGVMRRLENIGKLAAHIDAAGDGPVNVFITYHSLYKLAQGHADGLLPAWDLIIADEAHRTAGSLDKDWAVVHDNDAIPSRRRLYMTATPKNVHDPERNDDVTCEVASMDDLSLYGPVVYRISLAESIDQGLLADYRLVVMEIHDDQLRKILGRDCDIHHDSEGTRVAAAQVALSYAMRKFNLTRTLSFHSRIKSAELFAETLHETAALMPDGGPGSLWTGTVSSLQDRFDRLETFAQFAGHAPDNPRAQRRVLTNSRMCLEGFDLPAIDSIMFADPKSSSIDIAQGVGRALRQPPGTGKIATIIVPIYLAPGEDPDKGMRGSPYWLLYQVMIALKVYDEHVVRRVERLELDELVRRFPPPAARPERADEIIPVLALNALDPHNSVWHLGLGSAERYHARHGNLDVPSRYLGPDRFYLGWWLGHQRSLRMNGLLLNERIDALDAYGMRWEHPRRSIEFHLQTAREYTTCHGHLAPLADETFQGTRIGRWVSRWRKEAHDRTLPHPYIRALDEINPWWNAPWPKQWQHTYVRALAATRTGTLGFPGLRTTSDDPLTDWLDSQIDLMPGLHPDQRNLLGALPFDHPLALLLRRPRSPAERVFTEGLRAARIFRREHQHLDVPYYYVTEQAGHRFRLGEWISRQRRDAAQLTRSQLDALESLHMRWIPRQSPPWDPGDAWTAG
ncbi:DEAD/DEAH box helicase family protein [Streptacidiphilus sp. P02-A3a]|nr:DEAD/DEAH box helicase family protein [Streptacidiphilus sp. P02-A3a]QMU73936.1 DEAD/DEAH box helicase family protein [Streptacidiphilus sp. P02-A3a]